MSLNYEFLISVFIFGIVICIMVGPITVMIVNLSARFGLKIGAFAAAGASTADFICSGVAFFLYSSIIHFTSQYKSIISVCSSILLMVLGLFIIVSAFLLRKPNQASKPKRVNFNLLAKRPFISMFLLTMASPTTIPIFAAFIGKMEYSISNADKIFGALAIFISTYLVQICLVTCANAAKNFLIKGNTLKYFNITGGVIIIGIGVYELIF